MKNLKLISFVGIDIHTNLKDVDLVDQDSKIQCEWSVLYSDSKSKTKHVRYPEYNFCKDFLDWGDINQMVTSIHLCGDVIKRYLNQEQDVLDLCKKATRIQLNLNIADYPDHEKLTDDILTMITTHNHRVILQQNKTKEKFIKVFLNKTKSKINMLYDGSGGFGREITHTPPPDSFHFSGYAGGINPENVVKIVNLIEANNSDNNLYYIDMESGVRENNIFSVDKCRQIINNLT
jgi:phosphoribosylanthranilate isomerase